MYTFFRFYLYYLILIKYSTYTPSPQHLNNQQFNSCNCHTNHHLHQKIKSLILSPIHPHPGTRFLLRYPFSSFCYLVLFICNCIFISHTLFTTFTLFHSFVCKTHTSPHPPLFSWSAFRYTFCVYTKTKAFSYCRITLTSPSSPHIHKMARLAKAEDAKAEVTSNDVDKKATTTTTTTTNNISTERSSEGLKNGDVTE